MEQFRIRIEWTEPDPDWDGLDAATWGRVGFFVGDDCITSNHPADSRVPGDSEFLEGPISGLAEWVADNFVHVLWAIRTPFPIEEIGVNAPPIPGLRQASSGWSEYPIDCDMNQMGVWQHRHTFGHADSPLALPSIVFLPEPRYVALAVDYPNTALDPTVRFTAPSSRPWPHLYVVRKEQLEEELGTFIERVINQASSTEEAKKWAAWLSNRWERSRSEAADPETRIRVALGDELSSIVRDARSTHPRIADTLADFLLDCSSSVREISSFLTEQLSSHLEPGGPDGAAWRRIANSGMDLSAPLFEQGYQLARRVRSFLREEVAPLPTITALLARVDVERDEPVHTTAFRAAAFGGRRFARIVPSADDERMRSVPSYRFAVSAALGRLLAAACIDPSKPIATAHGRYARLLETRRANAFAVELLLPRRVLEVRASVIREEGRVPQALCEDYGISQSAANWHAYNAGVLSLRA